MDGKVDLLRFLENINSKVKGTFLSPNDQAKFYSPVII